MQRSADYSAGLSMIPYVLIITKDEIRTDIEE